MILFWLLILAHFIADFPLQSDKIFALKFKYSWGLLPHIFISFITNLVIAFPYVSFNSFWIAILFLAIVHFLLDWLKILLTKNLLNDSMFTFLFDQILHIFFIWISCYCLFDIPTPEINNKLIAAYYFNKKIIIVIAGLIFSIFGGGVLIHYIRKAVHQIKIRDSGEVVAFPEVNKRRIGYIERFFSTLGTIIGGWFLILIPLAFLPRIIYTGKINGRESAMINLVSGLTISIGIGLLVHLMW